MPYLSRWAAVLAALGLLSAAWSCQTPVDHKRSSNASSTIALFLGSDATGQAVDGTQSVALANAVVGTPSTTTFTIVNQGSGTLTLKTPAIAGPDAPLFQIATPPTLTLGKGASSSFAVQFSPVTAGTGKTATLTIENSSSNAPIMAFGITADATAPAPFVYFVKQSGGTTTAVQTGSSIAVSATYGPSGNAFKYVSGVGFYGTNSNGFIALPTPMTGDFSATAVVTVTAQNKANNACGIGLGITTGFNATDKWAYALARNSSNVVNGYYVSGATAVSAGAPSVAFTNNTAFELSFSRTGTNLTYGGASTVGGTPATNTAATSFFTDGTTNYGAGSVYPVLSFNNVNATISSLIIKNAAGEVVFDLASGVMVNYVPAALSLSTAAVNVNKTAAATVTATANAIGGAVSPVTAVAADPTIVDVAVSNGTANSTITLTGLKGGTTTVTVTNTADSSTVTNTKTISVSVNEFSATDAYGSLAAVAYPVPGAVTAYPDGELALTFDAVPTLNSGGTIKIYKKSDGSQVDSIAFAGETVTSLGTVLNVGSQLVRVSGNTLLITPHYGVLAYGTEYYVAIPTTSITGTLNGTAFAGLSNNSTVATWSFTTRAAPAVTATNITVDGAQNSTANFRTLGAALRYASTSLTAATSITINVAAGTYTELLRYVGAGAGQTVTILGPAGNAKGSNCLIQWTNGNNMNGSTQTRASFYFNTAHLVLKNLSFKNTGTRSAVAQAETLYFSGGSAYTLAATNCSFSSHQDTIQTTGRNWFYDCFIEGNTDFIWGTADAALFENCSLRVINDTAGANYAIFVARTGTTLGSSSGTIGKGYVLLNSTVSVDSGITATFGRDAGTGSFYDQVALVNNTFTGAGTIGADTVTKNYLWSYTTAPLKLGDSTYVGWKAVGNTGLNLPLSGDVSAYAATAIADQSNEYDTRDHILNRVVTVTGGTPSGYQAAAATWNLTSLAADFGAP